MTTERPIPIDRLSPIDAAFLHVEDRSNRMQLAGMLIFDADPPGFAEFREAIVRSLPLLPHFRQWVRPGTLALRRPSWVDDADFDVDYHLHHVALPAPGGPAEIAGMIDDLTAQPLDLQRSPWELTLVEGLAGGGFALALKVHHCMVDGLSIMDIFAVLCSPDPHYRHPEPAPWTPTPAPALWKRRAARPRRSAAGTPLDALRRLPRAARLAGRAPVTRFNSGPSSAVRRTEYLTVPLSVIHDIRRAHGTTVNNAVLATVTGALQRYLSRHDELVDELYAFVPVNRRADAERGTHGNRIAMTYPALPVGELEPNRRVEAVLAAVDAAARSRQAEDTAALADLTRYTPQPVAAAINRAMQLRSRIFNLTVTNVPGPPIPVYFLGRQLSLILGATPLTRKHALTVAVLSYKGNMTFSVTTDPRRVPDLDDLMTDFRSELDLLHALAGGPVADPSTVPTTRSTP
ncbi:wax ester/triacylglycerol synthase family O-acyltransferase [Skermania piniformis]|uniref:Diacylglycerol O-acyltransferase n=1 Tax=Skermania pinensis TaxID=39122 RepID=A0ABX8S8H8_9ACTN|nr:wax ester/triacylglycerol synthase family O-acyltransferase [Skermania piniformis]QXQ13467.1 wax ester/triacylglycerol synthase family O-acyltransferase [Skermania piniformis]